MRRWRKLWGRHKRRTTYVPMSGMDEWALFGFLDNEFGGAKNFSIKVSWFCHSLFVLGANSPADGFFSCAAK